MQDYVANVSAPSNGTPDTEDVFIEYKNRTGGSPARSRILKITVTCDTENFTGVTKIRFLHTSTAGSGGVAATVVKKYLVDRGNASVTPQIKNGSANFTAGTTIDVFGQWAINGKIPFVWQAASYEDQINLTEGEAICVMIASSSASIQYSVTLEWQDSGYSTMCVQATTNGTANTEDQFITVAPNNFVDMTIKRIRICPMQAVDATIKARLVLMTTAGSGYIAGTGVRKDPLTMGTGGPFRIKDTTVNAPAGTITDVYDRMSFNGRDFCEWIAGEDDEEVRVKQSVGVCALLISATQASIPLRVMMEVEY